jgi:hypothetical protein
VLAVGHTRSLKITTMLVKQEYKVDLISLKNARDQEGLLKAIHEKHAMEFGMFIADKFPVVKNEENSFKGDIPEMCLNREHQFTDHYERQLIILTEQEATFLKQQIRRSNLPLEIIPELLKLLS